MLSSTSTQAQWQALYTGVAQYHERWLTGAPSQSLPSLLPADHQTVPPLQALALCSQLHLFTKPTPSSALTAVPALPTLSVATLPTRFRPAFRALLRELSSQPQCVDLLLKQLLRHGFTPHPLDWLPQANDSQLPEQFLPWICFAHGVTQPNLTAASWPDLPHTLRLVLLQQQRRQQPQLSHDLLLACIEGEAAERRCSYLELLQTNLTVADEPLLRRGLSDRSEKVRQICRQFLYQLDLPYEEPPADKTVLQDLTQWLQQERCGFLLTSKKIVAKLGKNSVQSQNLVQALAQTPLPQIANALDITVDTLLTQWSFADNQGTGLHNPNYALLSNAARYLPHASVVSLLKRLTEQLAQETPQAKLGLTPLLERLSQQQQLEWLQHLLSHGHVDFDAAVSLNQSAQCWLFMTPALWQSSKLNRQFSELLNQWQQEAKRDQVTPQLERCLRWFGLLLPADTARVIMQQACAAGLAATSPMLETLNFQLNLP